MTRPDDHDRYAELAAGHALSALEPEDEQAFLAHVTACSRCERDLAVHRATLAHLAYAPEAVEPPPTLLDGIRAGVLASGRGATFRADDDATGAQGSDAATTTSLDEVRRRRDATRLRRTAAWTSIAAAAAMVLGLGVWNTSLQQDRELQDARSERLAAAIDELREDDTDTVPIKGTDGAVVAVALVHERELSLVVDGLPVNDDASTYVLWSQDNVGAVRAVGAFDVSRAGLDVEQDLPLQPDVRRFMVTREQGKQAPAEPTQPVLATGDV